MKLTSTLRGIFEEIRISFFKCYGFESHKEELRALAYGPKAKGAPAWEDALCGSGREDGFVMCHVEVLFGAAFEMPVSHALLALWVRRGDRACS